MEKYATPKLGLTMTMYMVLHVLATNYIDSEKGHLSVTGSSGRGSKALYLFWAQVSETGGLDDFCQVSLTVTCTVLEQAIF